MRRDRTRSVPAWSASAMIRSGCIFCAIASPSSAERALASVTSSAPANVMAKAFWIVTLSSAIKIRLAMFFWISSSSKRVNSAAA